MDFGTIFGSLFWWVFIFWLSFFEYVFCIDFSLNFGWILVSFLMFFGYLYRSHMQPSKSSKYIVFPMNFNDFTIQRNMIFNDFPDFFWYQLWHWFLMRFGIDFGSILGAFCNYFHVFSTSVFASIFWSTFWWKIDQNWSGETYPDSFCFVFFSITLVPFTHVIPTSARKLYLQLFSKN